MFSPSPENTNYLTLDTSNITKYNIENKKSKNLWEFVERDEVVMVGFCLPDGPLRDGKQLVGGDVGADHHGEDRPHLPHEMKFLQWNFIFGACVKSVTWFTYKRKGYALKVYHYLIETIKMKVCM